MLKKESFKNDKCIEKFINKKGGIIKDWLRLKETFRNIYLITEY